MPSAAHHDNHSPAELFGELFTRVAKTEIFADPKSWVDMTYDTDQSVIMQAFRDEDPKTDAELSSFIHRYFKAPQIPSTDNNILDEISELPINKYIDAVWSKLWRPSHDESIPHRSSVIALPNPYLVAGGRFGEFYYWDSYFSLLGFLDREPKMINNMADNFAYMIKQFGFVPNGNRTYYLSRSQPPFFHCLVGLTQPDNKAVAYAKYIDALQSEYDFWMDQNSGAETRCITMPDGALLNRYYDRKTTPRDECYRFDVETAANSQQSPETLFRNIRAGAESGWDFTSRWFGDGLNMGSIRTTSILPVDLNAIVYGLETALAQGYEHNGDLALATQYQARAAARKQAMSDYFWNYDQAMFMDYDLDAKTQSPIVSCAGLFPLFFGCATAEQAKAVAKATKTELLKAGGLVATAINSGEQWDSPNGWSPLQWIAIQGLKKYGYDDLADEIGARWINTVKSLYQKTGALYEKYNVVDMSLAGGGEYEVQLGFGWTNGVIAALLKGL